MAGASLVTMYFVTGEGKALEDESLMTSVLLNILEFLDTLTVEKEVRHKNFCFDKLLCTGKATAIPLFTLS